MKFLKAKAMSDKLILGVTVHVQIVEHDLQEDTIMIQILMHISWPLKYKRGSMRNISVNIAT